MTTITKSWVSVFFCFFFCGANDILCFSTNIDKPVTKNGNIFVVKDCRKREEKKKFNNCCSTSLFTDKQKNSNTKIEKKKEQTNTTKNKRETMKNKIQHVRFYPLPFPKGVKMESLATKKTKKKKPKKHTGIADPIVLPFLFLGFILLLSLSLSLLSFCFFFFFFFFLSSSMRK